MDPILLVAASIVLGTVSINVEPHPEQDARTRRACHRRSLTIGLASVAVLLAGLGTLIVDSIRFAI
jgi:hypothetical protein